MSDEERRDEASIEDIEEWKDRAAAGEDSAQELFRQVSHIAMYLSYDLIDKLRYWEKETLKLSEAEIAERLPHMSSFLDRLKVAYETFADVDL